MNVNDFLETFKALYKSKYMESYDAYAVKIDDIVGVAVVTNNKEIVINERFQQVFIKNTVFSINGEEKTVVFLSTKSSLVNEKFCFLAMNFLDIENRNIILSNPYQWYIEWKNMLGDHKKNNLVYDVLGEMVVLLKLQIMNKNPRWDSTTYATVDIVSNDALYEVKSTTNKTFDLLTVHSQFQAETKDLELPMYVVFVRLEDNDVGESIETLYQQLVENGFSQNILDKYLEEKGYGKGKYERNKKYRILETRLYKVDDKFPKITQNSFKNDQIPLGVIKLEYVISLTGLDYTNL